MRTPSRTARPKLATEVPLADDARVGTADWRNINGIQFCHWDRWLLRLSLEEPEGLPALTREFRRRARAARTTDDIAEAMLAQLDFLEERLVTLGRTPADLLDAAESASTWLRDKAVRRIWRATSLHRTAAMNQTPRKVLEARALVGNWAAFPVSLAVYFTQLQTIYNYGYVDYRAVGLVVWQLDFDGSQRLAAAHTDDERLAIRRAMLSACVEAMAHGDDSGDHLGQLYREQEQAYLSLVSGYLEHPGVLRDLLELATWEDYGLFHQLETFLAELPEVATALAAQELARFIAELNGAELEYQGTKARELRGILRTKELFEERERGDGE